MTSAKHVARRAWQLRPTLVEATAMAAAIAVAVVILPMSWWVAALSCLVTTAAAAVVKAALSLHRPKRSGGDPS